MSDFLRLCNSDPKALIRKVLLELLGVEKLSKLNASLLPKYIFGAVERFANTKVSKCDALNMAEYKRCITNYFISLKNKQELSTNAKLTKRTTSKVSIKSMENLKTKVVIKVSLKENDMTIKNNHTICLSRTSSKSRSLSRSISRSRSSIYSSVRFEGPTEKMYNNEKEVTENLESNDEQKIDEKKNECFGINRESKISERRNSREKSRSKSRDASKRSESKTRERER